jgi:hypothetical protein
MAIFSQIERDRKPSFTAAPYAYVALSAAKGLKDASSNEVLRGVYPESAEGGRFFASLRMTSKGLRITGKGPGRVLISVERAHFQSTGCRNRFLRSAWKPYRNEVRRRI